MKPFAQEITSQAIAQLAVRRGVPFEPEDAVWVCHAVISILAPVSLPDATIEQLATWFTEWLPEIEAKIRDERGAI
jgi:hypothetical protein